MWDGGRPVPLTYAEIDAWSRAARVEVSGEEAESIQLLSQHYCASYASALDPACADPCADENAAQAALQNFRSMVERYK